MKRKQEKADQDTFWSKSDFKFEKPIIRNQNENSINIYDYYNPKKPKAKKSDKFSEKVSLEIQTGTASQDIDTYYQDTNYQYQDNS